MSLWAVMLVKDEADVIEHTIRHIITQGVDGIIVSDNASSDGTRGILERLQAEDEVPIMIIDDAETGHYQSRKTTAMANTAAGEYGATWIWPCDADEIAFHDSGQTIDAILSGLENTNVVEMDLFTHLATALDPPDENPFKRMSYRVAQPQPLPKVIVRWRDGCVIHEGNHGAEHPAKLQGWREGLRIAHCPYRSEEQFIRKAVNGGRAYAATDLPWGTGQHWREMYQWYERGGEDALREIYREHFLYSLPSASGLVYDPIPVQA